MQRISSRFRLLTVLVPLVLLTGIVAGDAQAAAAASLKVKCTTSNGSTWSSTTKTAQIWSRGTHRSTTSGTTVPSGGKVVCEVLVSNPDTATASAQNFTPSSTGPAGERIDTFTAGAAGEGRVTYTLVNGAACIVFTFKYRIVPASSAQ